MPVLARVARKALDPLDDNAMQAELTAVMAALGMGLPQDEKTEWMATAMITLGQFPAGLTREALHEALTSCDSVRQVLKFVKTYCEDYPDRMRIRAERMDRLVAITEGRDHV